jgi:hypothetical protein
MNSAIVQGKLLQIASGTVDEVCIVKRDKKSVTQEMIMSYAKAKNLPS